MKEKILSKQSIYYGDMKMPEGFEIDCIQLVKDITISQLYETKLVFSRAADMVRTYVTDYATAYHSLNLQTLDQTGHFYAPFEQSGRINLINPLDLKNSPDHIMLYGVEADPSSCSVKIHYDDNRRKNLFWNIPLENNKFILFPGHLEYSISRNLRDKPNYILTTTFHEPK